MHPISIEIKHEKTYHPQFLCSYVFYLFSGARLPLCLLSVYNQVHFAVACEQYAHFKRRSFMKLKQFLIPIIAVFALAACSENAPFKEGKYTTLKTPVDVADLAPVIEIISLSCDNCRAMENAIPAIEAAANVEISKTHVTFNESATLSALIYYAASTQENGKPQKKLVEDLFKYVQEEQSDSAEQNKVILGKIFNQYGLISLYDLDEEQKKRLFAAIDRADKITDQAGITSVPTFMVKGKYILNTTAHDSAEDLAATITMLLNKND